MPQSHNQYLHELLREDQEPFQLNAYIADRRRQLQGAAISALPPKTSVRLKKRLPIVDSSSTKTSLCFFSVNNSPDVRKSPLSFPSNGRVVLHVPARTAALLLEAALRIQKQQAAKKQRLQMKSVGFGLFGSILKRLKDRNKNKKRESNKSIKKLVGSNMVDIAESKSVQGNGDESLLGFPFSCNHSRLSSAGWSETNEEKSLDLETSSSCRTEEDFEEIDVDFRFSLGRCESPGRRTPDFSSPAASPVHYKRQDTVKFENEVMEHGEDDEEEGEMEQCSPVSVLDPPFEDDNYGPEEDDDRDLESSYDIVQRAQQQLLSKLSRFEKLAELDAIELEKIMIEEEEDDEQGEVIPLEMKRLVSDLISEEKGGTNREMAWGRVCRRLDSWKESKSETIDMMVEIDLREELSSEWKTFPKEVEETAMEIEVAIFGGLVDEFSGELSVGTLNKILT